MWGLDASWTGAMSVIGDLPLFWPAAVCSLLFAAGLTRPVARLLGTSAWSAFGLLGSVGVIASATMTPSVAAFFPVDRPAGCLLGQFEVPALADLMYPNETSLNVALFVPLGLACVSLRRWSQVLACGVLAAGLPAVIEFVQHEVVSLGRVCSTADVADNLTGLVLGLVVGIVVIRPLSSRTPIDAVARGPR